MFEFRWNLNILILKEALRRDMFLKLFTSCQRGFAMLETLLYCNLPLENSAAQEEHSTEVG